MTDTYDHVFADESAKEFYQWMTKPSDFKNASLKIEGDFNNPPLRESFQLVSRFRTPGEALTEETFELRDRLARACILKKNVSFWLDDVQVGAIAVLTDMNQTLEADAFLSQNPVFYQLLLEDTTAFVLKKYTSPRKDTVPAK
jgi:hypothetical protein